MPLLGSDGKPVFNPDSDSPSIQGADSFNQWFNNVPDVNKSVPFEVVMEKMESSTNAAPIYSYENNVFFPIDGLLFGNQERAHNYHFTFELHTQFTYTGPQDLRFVSDDDLYVFINNELVIDLGGMHSRAEKVVNTGGLNLIVGETYPLDLFFAERHTTESYLTIQTGIELENPVPIVEPAAVRSFSHQYYKPGEQVTASIDVINSGDYVQSWTVVEKIPLTWSVNEISHNGVFENNRIRWQIVAEPGTTRLTYKLTAPTVLSYNTYWSGSVENQPLAAWIP